MTPSTKLSVPDSGTDIGIAELTAGMALLKAAAADNFSGVTLAKQAGAYPGRLYPDSENGGASRVSAAWQCVLHGASRSLAHVLGERQTTVPLAYEAPGEGAVGLFDALAEVFRKDSSRFQTVWLDVQGCFDFSSRDVAHRAWDMALKMVTPADPAEMVHISRYVYISQIFSLGATPEGGAAEWERLLSRHVKLDEDGRRVASMATRLFSSPCAEVVVRQMLESGVDPDLRIDGLPLLHHASLGSALQVSKHLIEAGADVDATCTLERLLDVLKHRTVVDPGQVAALPADVRPVDVARLQASDSLVSLYEAHAAKAAIDAVVKKAQDQKGAP